MHEKRLPLSVPNRRMRALTSVKVYESYSSTGGER